VWFLSGLALTAVAGGLAIWSWVDTLDAAADFMDVPTQEKYDAGVVLELRSTILVITTASLGAITLLLLPFTNWSGGPDDEESSTASLDYFGVSPTLDGGVSVAAGGRF
jgi:hypothetical protein